jgi:hypothetical protein
MPGKENPGTNSFASLFGQMEEPVVVDTGRLYSKSFLVSREFPGSKWEQASKHLDHGFPEGYVIMGLRQ